MKRSMDAFMKRYILLAIVVIVSCLSAVAVNTPTYQSPLMKSGVYSMPRQDLNGVSAYGTVMTTSSYSGPTHSNGPRRTLLGGGEELDQDGFPVSANIGDTFVKDGHTYMYAGPAGWIELTDDSQQDVDDNQIPVGSPMLPMTLFALLMAGAVYLRRRKAQQA